MARMPDIAIVTPNFNLGEYLEQTISSVINQQGASYEYVMMDGGSTDNSLNIIRKYKKYFHYLQSENDGGQANAINIGFSKTSAQIMAYINSDDYYSQNIFPIIKEFFDNNPDVDIVVGHCNVVNSSGEVLRIHKYKHQGYSNYLLPTKSLVNYIPQPATFWRRKVWEAIKPFNVKYNNAFDYDFFLRALLHGFNIKTIPIIIACYREHSTQKSNNRSLILEEVVDIVEKASMTTTINRIQRTKINKDLQWCVFRRELNCLIESSKTTGLPTYYANLIKFGLKHRKIAIKDNIFYWAFLRPVYYFMVKR